MQDIASFIALNRFGMGAGPGDADRPGDDPRGWLHAQVRADLPMPAQLAAFRSSAEILAGIYAARLEQPNRQGQAVQQAINEDYVNEVLARAGLAVATPTPLVERMVLFWSNHFTASATRRVITGALPAFEREAIREHVFGRFADMLKATTRHPCMIIYLDNAYSIGPESPAGRQRLRRNATATTMNENLAREVLELHTLGVDGGYTQDDVIQFAQALTGWSHGGLRRGGAEAVHGNFQFVRRQHQPGPKTILGRTYDEAADAEGLAILDDLARHPATARHLATKLARHFIADDPPQDAIEHLTQVYLDSDTDLGAVTHALIDLDAAWADPLAKVKSHYEFIIAAHRAIGPTPPRQRDLIRPLRLLAQLPFRAPSPQGWGDRAADWVSPEALMLRLEWAHQYAAHLPGGLVPRAVLEGSIGAVARPVTATWVNRAPTGADALTMLFGSPEFQRR